MKVFNIKVRFKGSFNDCNMRIKGYQKIYFVRILWFSLLTSSVVFLGSCNRDKNERTQPVDTIRFFAFGDWGRDGMSNQKELADAMEQLASKREQDFILTLGDNFYPSGVGSVDDPQWKTSFEDIYRGSLLKPKWYAALGNHDYLSDPTAEIAYSIKSSRWRMPFYFYTVKFNMKDGGSLRMVVLDTSPFEKSYYADPTFKKKFVVDTLRQKAWMDSVFSLKDSDWTIVTGHHPIYTGGARINEFNSVRNSLLPIFTRYQLPVYFAGHEHDLQHLKPPDLPTHQFVSGAGSELRGTGTMSFTIFAASVQGFMSVELTRKVMSIYVINYKLDTLYHTQLLK